MNQEGAEQQYTNCPVRGAVKSEPQEATFRPDNIYDIVKGVEQTQTYPKIGSRCHGKFHKT